MISPSTPNYEYSRLNALQNLNMLDTLPEERFDRITRLAQRIFQVPIVLVSLVDTNRQWFKSCIGLNVTETSREVSFCGHAILSNDTFIIPDALEDVRFYDNPLVTGDPHIRFYAGQPLHGPDGFRVGTLCLIDTHPQTLNPEDLKYLKDLAIMVENELSNLEFNRAVQALYDSELRFRKLAQSSPDYIFLFDLTAPDKGKVLYFNRETFFGHPPDDILDSSLSQKRIHPADLETVLKYRNEARQGKTRDVEYRILNSAGKWEWVESRQSVFETDSNGKPTQLLVTFNHISQRKEAERALQDSKIRYQILIEALDEGIVLQDQNAVILASNASAQKILGLTRDQMEGRTSLDPRWRAIHEDGSAFPGEEHPIPQTLLTGQPQSNVIMGVHKPEGSLVWISINSQPLFHSLEELNNSNPVTLPYAAVASFRDITELKEKEDKLTRRAYYDSLTGLPNHRLFNERLEYSVNHSQRHNETFAVGFIDLDRFKTVNDTFGHAIGDELLKEVAQRMRNCVRQTDIVARIGGDEFAILLTNIGLLENISTVAEKILNALHQKIEINGLEVITSASIGLSLYPANGENRGTLLKKADEAMYEAKKAGRNTFRIYKENSNVTL